ncbi:MAG: YcxB family protein [Pyrinomonadaceae bacterium]
MLLINFVAYFVAPHLRFRREPKLHDEYFLKFSEDGIVFKTADIDSNLQWSLYDKVWETEKFYFLFYGRNTFTLIPKRAFESREQKAVFKSMLRRKIKCYEC